MSVGLKKERFVSGDVFDQFPVVVAVYQHLYREVWESVIEIGQT